MHICYCGLGYEHAKNFKWKLEPITEQDHIGYWGNKLNS